MRIADGQANYLCNLACIVLLIMCNGGTGKLAGVGRLGMAVFYGTDGGVYSQ